MGCVLPIVIWSEFRKGQYRDDDHRENTSHFIFELRLASESRSERRPLRPNPNHKHRSRYLDSPVGSYESPPIRGYSDYTSKPQNIPVRSPGRTHRDIRGRDKGIRLAGNSLSESFG